MGKIVVRIFDYMCSECGRRVAFDANYCDKCGEEFKDKEIEKFDYLEWEKKFRKEK